MSHSRGAVGADALVRGARLKLRQLGLSEQQIGRLTRAAGDPVELLLPGKSVWIYAQIYEYEAPLVKQGQTMVVTSPALPGERFTTEILAIDPILDPTTRTTRVRGLVSTPDATLRPESFVDVMIHVPLGSNSPCRKTRSRHRRASARLRRRTTGRSSHVPSSSGAKRKATTRCARAFRVESRSSRRRTSSSTRSRASGRARGVQTRQRTALEVTRPMVERIIEFSARTADWSSC
jgi:hypothetical protein